jgi:uncharacterized protein YcbK (DUF882 family)
VKYFRITAALLVALAFGAGESLVSGAAAEAKSAKASDKRKADAVPLSKKQRRGAKKKRRHAKKQRVCTGKGKKRRCRYVATFQGHGVPDSALRTEPLPKPSGDIELWSVNLREDVKVHIYDEDGELDDAALAELDHGFRCKRTKEERAVDPRLYEIASIIYDHFGQKRMELVSGFRFQRNEGSRHFHASAMDIRIPGVSAKQLYKFAESLDTGGMGIGIYPRAGFVHIDFRAPGAKSYRWIDRSRGDGGGSDKAPSRQWKRSKRPNS